MSYLCHTRQPTSPCYKEKSKDQDQLTPFPISKPSVSTWSSAAAREAPREAPQTPSETPHPLTRRRRTPQSLPAFTGEGAASGSGKRRGLAPHSPPCPPCCPGVSPLISPFSVGGFTRSGPTLLGNKSKPLQMQSVELVTLSAGIAAILIAFSSGPSG